MPRSGVRFLASVAAISLAGCWPLFTPIQPQRRPSSPPASQSYASPASTSSAAQDETRDRSLRKRTASRSHQQPASAASPSPATASPNAGATKPMVTLAGEDHSETNAERLLDQVDHRLDAIDRNKLNAADVSTYDQANGFASSARQALADHDYVVASGLAEKASALVGRLNTTGSER